MKPEIQFLRRPLLNGRVNFPVCLAPMVGLSHVVLRLIVRDYMPVSARTVWPTEMLNSWRLPHEDLSRLPEAQRGADETELVPQILGNEEDAIARSIAKLEEWGAEGIDINMGCPVSKALRHNYGVALMGDRHYAAEVVRMATRNSRSPVSVKLRAGLQNDFSYLRDFVGGLAEAGASWVTLHPRVGEQKRRGSADWSQIKRLRDEISIPVIGNGDVQTCDDVFAMLSETDCDSVMIGRALAARPWLIRQVAEDLGWPVDHPAPRTPEQEGAEYGRCLFRFIDLARIYFSPELALRKFRFYVRTTSVWLEFGHTLISISTKCKSFDEIEIELRKFFSVPVRMTARTALRE